LLSIEPRPPLPQRAHLAAPLARPPLPPAVAPLGRAAAPRSTHLFPAWPTRDSTNTLLQASRSLPCSAARPIDRRARTVAPQLPPVLNCLLPVARASPHAPRSPASPAPPQQHNSQPPTLPRCWPAPGQPSHRAAAGHPRFRAAPAPPRLLLPWLNPHSCSFQYPSSSTTARIKFHLGKHLIP
jgi:hypothetical protein